MKKLLLITLFLFSCSNEVTFDEKKAVLAFSENGLKIDENLQNKEIATDSQKNSKNYNVGNDDENKNIENFYFKPISQKKFLKKSDTTWARFKPFNKDRFVFEPIIVDNKIYELDPKGVLSAFDLKTKKTLFKKRIFAKKYFKLYQNPRINYFENVIYAIAGSNEIVAASAVDGKILWSKKILSIPISKPVCDGKNVFVTTNDNKTYALNKSNGDLVFLTSAVSKPTAIFGSSNPIIHKEKLFVAYSSGEIYAIDKNNGEIFWSQNLNINKATDSDFYLNDIDATPIVKNDVIFAIGNGGLLMAIDIKNGSYIWKKEIASITDFAASSEFLFVVDNADKLIAINQKNGAIKYISQLPNYKDKDNPETKIIYKSVKIIGDKLIISDIDGSLLIDDIQSGKIEQTFKTGQKLFHPPIVVDGKIYLHTIGKFSVNLIEIW